MFDSFHIWIPFEVFMHHNRYENIRFDTNSMRRLVLFQI